MRRRVHHQAGRHRQAFMSAGIGRRYLTLTDLRTLVEETADWPERTTVRLLTGGWRADTIKVDDIRDGWEGGKR